MLLEAVKEGWSFGPDVDTVLALDPMSPHTTHHQLIHLSIVD
jgi:hypothetical protein